MKRKSINPLIEKIKNTAAEIGRDVVLMEVCGTHTQAISEKGIRNILPKNIKLISGPGCPVCVTAQEDIDMVVHLALSGIPIATYGDMLRVPGNFGSLEEARSAGAKVFSVYSVEDALRLRKQHPNLVFFGLGFDTTAPMTAVALEEGLITYSVHKLFLPAMEALLEMNETKIDGFISPGHVSAIAGIEPYRRMKMAQVITGFETEDLIVGIYMLLRQIAEGRREVENEYKRAVKEEGNLVAQKIISKYFTISDAKWRGFGMIPRSGLAVKDPKLNAKIVHKGVIAKMDASKIKEQSGCKCGEIIRGLLAPEKCPMFAKACTPKKPFGPCMVSQEGACSVEYKFRSLK